MSVPWFEALEMRGCRFPVLQSDNRIRLDVPPLLEDLEARASRFSLLQSANGLRILGPPFLA